MSNNRQKFTESLEGFGIKTDNAKAEVYDENHTLADRAAGMQSIVSRYGKSSDDESRLPDIIPPITVADDEPFSKKAEALRMKAMAEVNKKDINHDETELLREAWDKSYKNCLVLLYSAMSNRRMSIAELRQEVLDKKSNLPKATREFVRDTNVKYIEGWMSRMYGDDYFSTVDWINERDKEEVREASAEEVIQINMKGVK